jgi:hypothetical protein
MSTRLSDPRGQIDDMTHLQQRSTGVIVRLGATPCSLKSTPKSAIFRYRREQSITESFASPIPILKFENLAENDRPDVL